MSSRSLSRSIFSAVFLIASAAYAAPDHPALSRVLHYTKTGFFEKWREVAACSTALESLSAKYGFKVTHSRDSTALLALQQYDLVIFDNNTDAGGSVRQSDPSRQALEDYMNAGGRFFGLGWASFHRQTWGWYDSVLFSGLDFQEFMEGTITLYKDTSSESESNQAVARMWKYAEDSLGIVTDSTVYPGQIVHFKEDVTVHPANPRGLPGVTVLQNVRGYYAIPAGSDYPQTWVKYLEGGGRLLYTTLGSSPTDWSRKDSWFNKAAYAYMRFLVGDFDSVSVASVPGIRTQGPRVEIRSERGSRIRVMDIRGRLVASGGGSAVEVFNLKPGVYLVKTATARSEASKTIVVP